MNAARRIDQLEQAEEQRFRAAAEFATFWRGNVWDEARQARGAAALRAAGCDGDVLAFLERHRLAQPPGDQALFDDMAIAVFGLVEGAYDDAAIRAALARLAPGLGCHADDSPVLLVRQLQATIAATPL